MVIPTCVIMWPMGGEIFAAQHRTTIAVIASPVATTSATITQQSPKFYARHDLNYFYLPLREKGLNFSPVFTSAHFL